MAAPRCGKCPGCRKAFAAVGDGSTGAERAAAFPCRVWPQARQLAPVEARELPTIPRLSERARALEAALVRADHG